MAVKTAAVSSAASAARSGASLDKKALKARLFNIQLLTNPLCCLVCAIVASSNILPTEIGAIPWLCVSLSASYMVTTVVKNYLGVPDSVVSDGEALMQSLSVGAYLQTFLLLWTLMHNLLNAPMALAVLSETSFSTAAATDILPQVPTV